MLNIVMYSIYLYIKYCDVSKLRRKRGRPSRMRCRVWTRVRVFISEGKLSRILSLRPTLYFYQFAYTRFRYPIFLLQIIIITITTLSFRLCTIPHTNRGMYIQTLLFLLNLFYFTANSLSNSRRW